jgi:hypothetical protein
MEKIASVAFFSIMIDTTLDISKKDMISEIYQYIEIQNDENGDPSTIKIYESTFMGLIEVMQQDATGIANELIECVRNTHTVKSRLSSLMKGRRCMNNQKH